MKNRSLSTLLGDAVLYKNPLLVKLLSLSVAVLACGTLKGALVLGLCTIVSMMLSALTVSAVKGLLTEKTRAVASLFICSGYVSAVCLFVKACMPQAYASYLPLIAFSGLCLSFCTGFAAKNGIGSAFISAFFSGLGYTAALMVTAFVRELFGRGELFGVNVFNGGVAFLTTPAGGFVCLAFIAAAVSFINSKRRSEDEDR